MKAELEYWDKVALDPDVDNKYICNISTEECLAALGELPLAGVEIGSGVGRLTRPYDIGIDISLAMVKIAQKRKPDSWFRQGDGQTLPVKDGTTSCVYSMLTFQHCDPETVDSYIKESYRVLMRGGILRFQTVLGSHHGFIDHNYTQDEIVSMMTAAGFEVSAIEIGLVLPQWAWFTGVKK